MNRSMRVVLGLAMVTLGACAGAALPRTQVPPPRPLVQQMSPAAAGTTDEAATQRWLQQEAARQRGEVARESTERVPETAARPQTVDEEATSAWLDRTIEERRLANPDRPPEPIYQTVERTVYVDRPVYRSSWEPYGYGYDDCGEPVYYRHYGYRGVHRGHHTFPVHTAVGAGLGAIIGHQSGRRDRGAAIGAGIGLLLDLAH